MRMSTFIAGCCVVVLLAMLAAVVAQTLTTPRLQGLTVVPSGVKSYQLASNPATITATFQPLVGATPICAHFQWVRLRDDDPTLLLDERPPVTIAEDGRWLSSSVLEPGDYADGDVLEVSAALEYDAGNGTETGIVTVSERPVFVAPPKVGYSWYPAQARVAIHNVEYGANAQVRFRWYRNDDGTWRQGPSTHTVDYELAEGEHLGAKDEIDGHRYFQPGDHWRVTAELLVEGSVKHKQTHEFDTHALMPMIRKLDISSQEAQP